MDRKMTAVATILLFVSGFVVGWSVGRGQGAEIAKIIGSRHGVWDPQWFDIPYWYSLSLIGVALVVVAAVLLVLANRRVEEH